MTKITIFALFLIINLFSFSQEICNNGIDDDNDGLIDLNDSQCICTSTANQPSSLIPNPSFELQNCCPQSYSELNCASNWVQASEGTADYIHNCNVVIPCLQTSNLILFPDGNGAAGGIVQQDYKEYIGACLNSPMIAGTQYTIQMSVGLTGVSTSLSNIDLTYLPPFQWTIYGAQTCGNIPYLGYDCPPSSIFTVLGSVAIINDGSYHLLTITFTPSTNISEIILGAPCTLPVEYPDMFGDFPYYMVDNLLINTSTSFGNVQITESGTACANNFILTATSASPGGVYQWYKNGIALVGQTNAALPFSTLGYTNGNYTVTYLLNGVCSSTSDNINNTTATIDLQVNDATVCAQQPATLTATGATSYTWSPSTGLSSTTGSSVIANPSVTTTYTVTGTSNNCISTTISTVLVQDFLTINITDVETCPGNPVNLTASGANSYTWSPATGLSSVTGATVISTVPTSTTYTVTGTAGTCTGQGSVTVTINNSIDFTATVNQNIVKIPETDVVFTALPTSNNYTWIFENEVHSNIQTLTQHIVEVVGEHEVILIAQNDEGCSDTLTLTIIVDENTIFYIPNSFTPDGDSYNNVFLPIFTAGFDPSNYHLTIYNKWGEILFESKNSTVGWDGFYNGEMSMDGTYVWEIEYKDLRTDFKRRIDGHITLLR